MLFRDVSTRYFALSSSNLGLAALTGVCLCPPSASRLPGVLAPVSALPFAALQFAFGSPLFASTPFAFDFALAFPFAFGCSSFFGVLSTSFA